MARTISICDRESKVYEHLAYKQNQQQRFVVRASRNQQTATGQQLFDALEAHAPCLGTRTVPIAQRGGRPARQAQVRLHAKTRTLAPPRHRRATGPALPMNRLWVQEVDALSGLETLCWRLLTSEPIQTAEQVGLVVRYYALRWRIEAYHKAWKSGAGVERQRIQHSENLKRMITVTAFVAVRLLHLREAVEPEVDN